MDKHKDKPQRKMANFTQQKIKNFKEENEHGLVRQNKLQFSTLFETQDCLLGG